MIEHLKELLDREPFQPFRIVTNSGKEYLVNNPYLIAIGEAQIFLYGPKDTFAYIRNNQITAVESSQRAA